MKALAGFVVLTSFMLASIAAGSIGNPADYQVSYTNGGGSARAMAMGNAFVGLANDVSGGIWNPAGLWVLEGPMVSVSYNLYSPAGMFKDNLGWNSIKNDIDMNAIGHFSFVAPVRIKGHPWVFNFNYNRSNEFSDKMAFLYDSQSGLNPDKFVNDQGFLRAYNFGGCTRIYKQLSIGFLVNIYDGRRTTEETRNFVRDSIINPVYGISVVKFTSDSNLDSTTSNGLNFTLGLMMKGTSYSVGAVARTPYTMKHSTDHAKFVKTTNNGLPGLDDSDTTYVVDSSAKQDVPLSLTLGGAVFPIANLTVTADVSYQNYGSTNWYYRTQTFFSANGDRSDFFTKIPIDWNNTLGVGIGGEYTLNSPIGQLPLRAGFRFDQLPQPKTITHTTSNVGYVGSTPYPTEILYTTTKLEGRQNEVTASLGAGIKWSRIGIDVAYRYRTGAEQEFNQYVIWYDERDTEDPVKSLYINRSMDIKTHEVRFTFTGYF